MEGYDPEKYLKMYENAEGGSSQEKINSMRRELEAGKRDEINARRREAYARRKSTIDEKEESIPLSERFLIPKITAIEYLATPQLCMLPQKSKKQSAMLKDFLTVNRIIA